MNHDEDLFDIGLRLLDRQMVGNEDELLGNVDNLLVETVDDRFTVTAIVSGPAGLGSRFGGRVVGWTGGCAPSGDDCVPKPTRRPSSSRWLMSNGSRLR